jgi:hypothetical protein
VGQIGGTLTYASIFVSLPFFVSPSASDDLPSGNVENTFFTFLTCGKQKK